MRGVSEFQHLVTSFQGSPESEMSDFHCTGFCSKRYRELYPELGSFSFPVFRSESWISVSKSFSCLSAGCLLLSEVWLPGECIESVKTSKVPSQGKQGDGRDVNLKANILSY